MIEPNTTRGAQVNHTSQATKSKTSIFRGLGLALSVAFCLGSASEAWAAPKDPTLTVTMSSLACSTPAGSGAFRVLSWSWGASNPVSFGSGSGGSVGKAIIDGLSFSKGMDSCSPALFGAVTSGRVFLTVTMVQTDALGAPLVTVTMSHAIVTSYEIGGTPGQTPAEKLTLAFDTICIKEHASGSEVCYDRTPQV